MRSLWKTPQAFLWIVWIFFNTIQEKRKKEKGFLWIMKEQELLFCEFLRKKQWFSTKEIQINPFFGVVFLAGVYYNKCGQESVKTEKSVDNCKGIVQIGLQ